MATGPLAVCSTVQLADASAIGRTHGNGAASVDLDPLESASRGSRRNCKGFRVWQAQPHAFIPPFRQEPSSAFYGIAI